MANRDIKAHVRTALHPAGTALAGVYVALYNSVGTFLESNTTNASGDAEFLQVAPGSYEMKIAPPRPGVVQSGSVQAVTVADSAEANVNTFDFAVNTAALPESSDPNLCRLSGYIVNMSGQPVKNHSLHFSESAVPNLIRNTALDRSYLVSPAKIIVKTDSNGYASVELIRGSEYMVVLEGYENLPQLVSVPDLAATSLPDVLMPVVENVRYSLSGVALPLNSPSAAVAAGASVELKAYTTHRSGVISDLVAVVFESSNADVFTVGVDKEDGKVTLTGKAAGSATLKVSRADSDISVKPTPALVGDLSVTVT